VTVTLSLLDAEALAATLRGISRYGISDAFPPEVDLATDAATRALLARAFRVARRLRRASPKDGLLDSAASLVAGATADKPIADQVAALVQAGDLLFAGTLK